ncbi:5-methylcytosine-specific restriction endonuclease McrA [Roseovarius sp. MBR-154]
MISEVRNRVLTEQKFPQIGRNYPDDFVVRIAKPRTIGSRASKSFPPGSALQGRRAFASHEVEWRTRAMGKLSNIRRAKMHAQEGRCYYCGLPMWDPETDHDMPAIFRAQSMQKALRCTAEHLLPRAEGGANSSNNIVAACWYCNTRRHHRKQPLSPDSHRARVQDRMAKGKWLAARLNGISNADTKFERVRTGEAPRH